MNYGLLISLIIGAVLAYTEFSQLKKQVTQQQKQLNELCRLMGQEQLLTYFVSDELKEKALHLKNSGKETQAIKEIRLATSMSLSEAKAYVDKL